MIGALRDSLSSVGLYPSSWHGPGAIATSLFQRENVKAHHRHDAQDMSVVYRSAYYGGRTELFSQGCIPTVTNYDINSAYPYHVATLPDALGRWVIADVYDPTSQYALWQVQWNIPGAVIAPFPYRRDKRILYSGIGWGWYHATEVASAIRMYPQGIQVLGGYIYHPASDARPFAFLPDLYNERKKLQASHHPGEKAIKLAINSLYGKLAQGTGSYDNLPPYQSYLWAGMITAGTRAQILDIARVDVESVLMIATDGIFFERDPQLPTGTNLGELSKGYATDAFIARAGMYQARDQNGNTFVKHRGYFGREVNWPLLLDEWRAHGPYGKTISPVTRFVGLGSAVGRGSYIDYGQWPVTERIVRLMPSSKSYPGIDDPTLTNWTRVRHTELYDPTCGARISDPYRPKTDVIEPDMADIIQGQEQPTID